MEIATARGVTFAGIPKQAALTVRSERTRFNGEDFATLSIADDKSGIMLEVVVTQEVKRLLKKLL